GLAAAMTGQLQARFASQGFKMIAPSQGVELFERAIARRDAHVVLVPLDLRAAGRHFGASIPPMWRALVRAPRAEAAPPDTTWASEVGAVRGEGSLEAATQTVRAEVARVLSLGRASAVPADRPLRELGLDSLMAVELRNALGRRTGVTLPANFAFEHPT